MSTFLSLIIPAYNEEQKIKRDLEEAVAFLSTKAFHSEIIVVNDGSRDNTSKIVDEFSKTFSSLRVTIRLIEYQPNRGKGYAIRSGIQESRGDLVAFADSGLCVPYRFLNEGIDRLSNGFDYALASRRLKGTTIHEAQPAYRRWGSRVFGVVVRSLMGITFVSDTQCGFKLYRKSAAQTIFSRVKTNGFMFDIEALLIARRLGMKGTEFAVEWSNDSDTRYHPVWGTLRNLRELITIRVRHAW